MEAEQAVLLYYYETRWLSRAKGLHRVFELKGGIAISLIDDDDDDNGLSL
jgi:hypothetical protein